MGLFQKTLGDVQKEVAHGKFDVALKYLDHHDKKEQELAFDLAGLQVAIEKYKKQLDSVRSLLLTKDKIFAAAKQRYFESNDPRFVKTKKISEDYLKQINKGYLDAVNKQLIGTQQD